ncbi:MAG: hypothetical protein V1649_00895 [Patescibacteria group bacterium]
MKRTVVIIILLLMGIFSGAWAELKLGINYPGIQIGYLFDNGVALEIRGEKGDGILTIGPRVSFYSSEKKGIIPFFAIEGDYISFKGKVSEGRGFAFQPMVGIEKRISNIGIEVTAGGAYLSLKDKATGFKESSICPVIGMGLNLYF